MREVIQALRVWDTDLCHQTLLAPGTILAACRILRKWSSEDGIEEYAVEFEAGGRRYACPLFRFQPRTQAVDLSFSSQLSAIH
jgi:hypothetical protein